MKKVTPPPDYRNMAQAKPLAGQIGRECIAEVVRVFYQRVRDDSPIAHHFSSISDWTRHEELIADYWWVALGGEASSEHHFAMTDKHRALNLSGDDFSVWLDLFRGVVEQLLPEDQARRWIRMASEIANLQKVELGSI